MDQQYPTIVADEMDFGRGANATTNEIDLKRAIDAARGILHETNVSQAPATKDIKDTPLARAMKAGM